MLCDVTFHDNLITVKTEIIHYWIGYDGVKHIEYGELITMFNNGIVKGDIRLLCEFELERERENIRKIDRRVESKNN